MERTIFRDQHGNLWLLKNVELVPYGPNDPATLESMKLRNLYGTGLSMSQDEFKQFLPVLLSNNISDTDNWFKTYNTQTFYNPNIPMNIHPIMALRILQKFGFQKYIDQDGLYKVEDVEHWRVFSMPRVFPSQASQSVILNTSTGIVSYLNQLVNFINSNPGILNRNINDIGNAQQIVILRRQKIP